MEIEKLLQEVKNNGREMKLLFVGSVLPTIVIAREELPLCYLANNIPQSNNEAFVIGRGPEANWKIENPYASSIHCAILRVGKNFHLYDCSLNGTTVK